MAGPSDALVISVKDNGDPRGEPGVLSGACQFLEWDSRFFAMRIARLTEPRLTSDSVASALTWCRANRIDCLYFLADSGDVGTAMLAQVNGFQLVDMRLTLERDLTHSMGTAAAVRPFQPADTAALRTIARVSHRDSRFYHDPRFTRRQCDALYEAWMERSCDGWADAVLVAECGGASAGYVSCHRTPADVGSIGLCAVAPEFQGRGLGRELVTAAFDYFYRNGIKQATVVTQGRNVASQRLYQRCGFLTQSMQLWYHRWFETDVPA
jgi:dTDP-4-amino-4,6-dideoxy-D-galactose acyltransferase